MLAPLGPANTETELQLPPFDAELREAAVVEPEPSAPDEPVLSAEKVAKMEKEHAEVVLEEAEEQHRLTGGGKEFLKIR